MAARVTILGLVVLATAGCGGGRQWPSAPRAVGDPAFVGAGHTIGTIDVLPVDLQVWASPGTERNPEELSGALQVAVSGMVAAELASRGYQVTSQMDWDGTYVAQDGAIEKAMSQQQVAETAYSLSGFGEAQRLVRDRMLVPYLPARLGETTGSEATLYVGGWAFAGKDRSSSSKAGKIAKGVLIGVLIVAVVAIAIAGVKDGGGGGAVGSLVEGAGKAAGGAVKVAGRVLHGVARVGLHAGKTVLRTGPDMVQASLEVTDAFGHSHTHIDVYDHRPDYYTEGAPRTGRSAMQLEMTLVDNRTGRVLWHTRQRFPARPEQPKEVERAVGTLLAALPAAR